jgi:NAD(P)-dependent dehydrogenase (short-subunit alcohol dehydrogenase family)
VEAEEGRLDGLVNNAGRSLGGFLELVEEEELRALLELNLIAPWALTRAALPLMRRSGPGTVVMVSSTSGLTALPGLGAYAASKFALEGLSEAWRHELALFGLRVVLIEPGAYATDIVGRNRQLSRGLRQSGPYAPWTRGLLEVFERSFVRLARDPEEVAQAILQILGDPSPPLRYPLGPGSTLRSMFRRILPFGLMEWGMARALERVRRRGMERGEGGGSGGEG